MAAGVEVTWQAEITLRGPATGHSPDIERRLAHYAVGLVMAAKAIAGPAGVDGVYFPDDSEDPVTIEREDRDVIISVEFAARIIL